MPFNSIFSWVIKKRMGAINGFIKHPIETQNKVLKELINKGKDTEFGKEHSFDSITNRQNFTKNIPLRFYEGFITYIEKSIEGQENILWPGKTQWFSKSSGTTNSKSKLIPVTLDAIDGCHYKGGKDLLAIYYSNHSTAKLFTGKHLILGGNTSVNKLNEESYFGDLSAIVVKNLPFWAETRRTPSKKITLMSNWDEKIDKMARAVIKQDVRILAGVPSWMLVLLHKVLEVSGKDSISDVWPNLEFYMHGGVNFDPYKQQFEQLIKNPNLNYYQTYNASEGFFGLQNEKGADDMLLLLDYGIYYEFIPMDEFDGTNSKTIQLAEVEVGKNYALVISTNAGLWRYILGDTVKFTSTFPFKIKVSGRTKHFINAFGEELIIDNTDNALAIALNKTNSAIIEYSVAPVYFDGKDSGAHQWLIEFEKEPKNIEEFAHILDKELKKLNSDYEAKRFNNMILKAPQLTVLTKGSFHKWLEEKGKLGGQNKIPRLSNNRDFIEEILVLDKSYI
jgi:hypothetical protein